VLFDLDHFKQINDRYGHQAGDRVLQRFTTIVDKQIRQSDVFGRWGGEEFLLICPETTADQARNVAEKIRHVLSEEEFEQGFTQTVSAGVMGAAACDNIDQLISAADKQLYAAKAAGRNRVETGGAD